MQLSDQQLWDDVLSGSESAWAELVRRYQSLIYAIATRMRLSQADAADCFQQTWLLLYQNRRKLQDPSRLSSWLVTTAKREALRLKRRAGRDPGEVEHDSQVDENPLADQDLEALEKQTIVQNALNEIDGRCRQLLHAFFFAEEETGYEEIARDLKISLNSLGPIRRRCLNRLKKVLEKMGHEIVRNLNTRSL
jgi:RNA polymerase sigma factor (sigma-70 family)